MFRATIAKWQVLGRYGRTMARRSLRGHRRLQRQGELGRVPEICRKLSLTPLVGRSFLPSNTVFGAAAGHAELAVRQFLCIRLILYRFSPVLLAQADGRNISLKYPLPLQWQRLVEADGFAVNRIACTALWSGLIIFAWGYGVATAIRLAFGAFLSPRSDAEIGPFVHFESLDRTNLPLSPRTYDPLSWYVRTGQRDRDFGTLTHRVKDVAPFTAHGLRVQPIPNPWLGGFSPRLFLRYGIWSISASGISLFHALRGRWWEALMLSEAARAAVVRLSPREGLAREYLFNNSTWLYRPLWTYEAERRGCGITFYHYSTNSEGFKLKDGYHSHFSFSMMSWPVHLVWDEGQRDFIRRSQEFPAEIKIVGPVWFADSSDRMPETNNAVAIFDVSMFRLTMLPMIGEDYIYYMPKTCSAFLRDTLSACRANGLTMAWKRKRAVGKLAHPEYRDLVNRLDEYDDVILVPPSISAFRVIEACAMVISMPYTSTALIGRHLNKPCCYYDPSGELMPDDRGAHGIPIIQSYDELVRWIGTHAPSALHRRPTTNMDSAS